MNRAIKFQPSAPADDAEVVRRSLRDPEEFAQLFDRHAAVIHRFVARRLGTQTADDVIADTFLAAFQRREHYDLTRADARPWLFGIAVNLIGKHRRSELRMLRMLARTGLDPVLDGDVERVDERLSAGSINRQLAVALTALGAADRHVLLLVAWAELSYQEVAVALGIPVGTVRSRLSRARRIVQESLRDQIQSPSRNGEVSR